MTENSSGVFFIMGRYLWMSEVSVGHIACGTLHMREYAFPDIVCIIINLTEYMFPLLASIEQCWRCTEN
jgi:hypothetical protein